MCFLWLGGLAKIDLEGTKQTHTQDDCNNQCQTNVDEWHSPLMGLGVIGTKCHKQSFPRPFIWLSNSSHKRSVFGAFFGGSNFKPDWRIQVHTVDGRNPAPVNR